MRLWYKLILKIPEKRRRQLLQWAHNRLAIGWAIKDRGVIYFLPDRPMRIWYEAGDRRYTVNLAAVDDLELRLAPGAHVQIDCEEIKETGK